MFYLLPNPKHNMHGSLKAQLSFGRVFVASLVIALVVVSFVINLVTSRISYGHNFLWQN